MSACGGGCVATEDGCTSRLNIVAEGAFRVAAVGYEMTESTACGDALAVVLGVSVYLEADNVAREGTHLS